MSVTIEPSPPYADRPQDSEAIIPLVILMPLFNDWLSADKLIRNLDSAFRSFPYPVFILIVDDASREKPSSDFAQGAFAKLRNIFILRLKKNMGHQRAIAIGLCHLHDQIPCRGVVVMDSDGEDEALDAVRLAQHVSEGPDRPVVFAERTRRSESIGFKLGYIAYRTTHAILTGRDIRVGNFSFLPAEHLEALSVEPMLWNHYAASVRTRLPVVTIPTDRGKRFFGKSHHNLVHLVAHGFAALPCYSEIIGVRLMVGSGLASAGALMTFFLLLKSGWISATSLSVGWIYLVMFNLLLAGGGLSVLFLMQVYLTRTLQPFLPARDYTWFVGQRTSRRLMESHRQIFDH